MFWEMMVEEGKKGELSAGGLGFKYYFWRLDAEGQILLTTSEYTGLRVSCQSFHYIYRLREEDTMGCSGRWLPLAGICASWIGTATGPRVKG